MFQIFAGFILFLQNFTIVSAFAYRLAAIHGLLEKFHSWRTVVGSLLIFALFMVPMSWSFVYAVREGRNTIYKDMEMVSSEVDLSDLESFICFI